MLPDFDEHGNLPPGIHRAGLAEIRERFGKGSLEREVETRELAEFVQWAKDAGVLRLIVDGSYATAKESPNDVDVVILTRPEYDRQQIRRTASAQWPFVHVQVALDEGDFIEWAKFDFGMDRVDRPRGVVRLNYDRTFDRSGL